jgi:PIN domain nuclease of toxin-antitoxin system
MRLLLDTHAFLWFVSGSAKLSGEARKLIDNPINQPYLSVASLWEMAIKVSIGKLSLDIPLETLIPQHMELSSINLLPIDLPHVAMVSTLPFHHRDPFDRLIIAQAMIEGIPVVSVDPAFDDYPITRLW